jgi:hypothetical protein
VELDLTLDQIRERRDALRPFVREFVQLEKALASVGRLERFLDMVRGADAVTVKRAAEQLGLPLDLLDGPALQPSLEEAGEAQGGAAATRPGRFTPVDLNAPAGRG